MVKRKRKNLNSKSDAELATFSLQDGLYNTTIKSKAEDLVKKLSAFDNGVTKIERFTLLKSTFGFVIRDSGGKSFITGDCDGVYPSTGAKKLDEIEQAIDKTLRDLNEKQFQACALTSFGLNQDQDPIVRCLSPCSKRKQRTKNKSKKKIDVFGLSLLALTLALATYNFQQKVSSQELEIQLLPDFNQISFSDFGAIEESGAIGQQFNQLAGYDVSRQFNAGDNPSQFLKLGDLEASLAPTEFTLEDISITSKADIDISTLPLSEFSLVGKQTIEDLAEAVPDLGEKKAEDVAPIETLLEQSGKSDDSDLKIKTLIQDPEIAQLELDTIDLQQFSIDEIPNIEQVPLEDFDDYKNSFIDEIPGLDEVPLADYPNSIAPIGSFVARIDLVWGSAESDRNRTISGSYVDGFQVPCETNCQYLELDDLENFGSSVQLPFEGKQWISGREHWVNGGTGCFAGGKEPTGIHPFGDTFKEVLWNTDESTDTATVMIFFNIKTSCGESPYFIGPIPFPLGNLKINDLIFIGTGV